MERNQNKFKGSEPARQEYKETGRPANRKGIICYRANGTNKPSLD